MNQSLKDFFERLTDDELLVRVQAGLTDEALEVAKAELVSRSLELPRAPLESQTLTDQKPAPYLGDLVILERDMTPTEAYILCECLQMLGIQAEAGDANMVQTYGLLAIAIGGAKVRVPKDQLAEAQQVLAAFRRGDFALRDDFDVGEGRS